MVVVKRMIADYKERQRKDPMQLKSSLSSAQRKEVYRYADSLGFYHHSTGTSPDRYVAIQATAPLECYTATIGRSVICALVARDTCLQRAPPIAVHAPSHTESEETSSRAEPSAEPERERCPEISGRIRGVSRNQGVRTTPPPLAGRCLASSHAPSVLTARRRAPCASRTRAMWRGLPSPTPCMRRRLAI